MAYYSATNSVNPIPGGYPYRYIVQIEAEMAKHEAHNYLTVATDRPSAEEMGCRDIQLINFYTVMIDGSAQNITVNLTVDVQIPGSHQYLEVKGLQPLSGYRVRVRSENINGHSEFTKIFTFKTYG